MKMFNMKLLSLILFNTVIYSSIIERVKVDFLNMANFPGDFEISYNDMSVSFNMKQPLIENSCMI